jgi:hypothetical protein
LLFIFSLLSPFIHYCSFWIHFLLFRIVHYILLPLVTFPYYLYHNVVRCFIFIFLNSIFNKKQNSALMGASKRTHPSLRGHKPVLADGFAFARTHFHPLMWYEGVNSRHGAGVTSRGEIPSFPSPLQIARHGPTIPTLACLAFGWWRWVRLILLPPYYRLARK